MKIIVQNILVVLISVKIFQRYNGWRDKARKSNKNKNKLKQNQTKQNKKSLNQI